MTRDRAISAATHQSHINHTSIDTHTHTQPSQVPKPHLSTAYSVVKHRWNSHDTDTTTPVVLNITLRTLNTYGVARGAGSTTAKSHPVPTHAASHAAYDAASLFTHGELNVPRSPLPPSSITSNLADTSSLAFDAL
jgi:hypothetical protein